jgi:phenylacetaldehyde dehydrogenase
MTIAINPGTRSDAVSAFLAAKNKPMLIGDQWVMAQGDGLVPSVDPATGEVLAHFPAGQAADVDAAVGSARAALNDGRWAGLTPSARSQVLWRIAELIEANIDELAELETLDQGQAPVRGPLGRNTRGRGAVPLLRRPGDEDRRQHDSFSSINYQPEGKRVFAYTAEAPHRRVVGAIVPWNSPLVLTAMNIAPALAAGCSVVLKPAENTSLTALRLGELALEAGLPERRPQHSHRLRSTRPERCPGRTHGCGQDLLHGLNGHGPGDHRCGQGQPEETVSLELGGKSPVIICDDADLDAAIPGAANAIFFNAGQVCVAGSRLYVQRGVFDQVVEGVAEVAKSITLGHGMDQDAQMGPLVSLTQAERVSGYMERACNAGARVVTGGERPNPDGAFIQPTVFTDVSSDMEIVREEVFGPVIVCQPFDDISEVTELANNSDYGLAASVWTESLSLAHRLASDIEAGTVWINCHSMYDASLPIGGIKQSGWSRLSGQQAVDNFLSTKTVCAVL